MKKEYYVYAIKSKPNGRIYVGISENPERRLRGHNRGETKSTRAFRPWFVIYQKMVGTRVAARLEEKRLKSGYGKEFLKSLNKPFAPR